MGKKYNSDRVKRYEICPFALLKTKFLGEKSGLEVEGNISPLQFTVFPYAPGYDDVCTISTN